MPSINADKANASRAAEARKSSRHHRELMLILGTTSPVSSTTSTTQTTQTDIKYKNHFGQLQFQIVPTLEFKASWSYLIILQKISGFYFWCICKLLRYTRYNEKLNNKVQMTLDWLLLLDIKSFLSLDF